MKPTRKRLIIGVALVALVAVAGCNNQSGPSGKDLADDTGVNVSGANVGESYTYEVRLTEKNQYGLVKAQPPFVMDESLERQNLIHRYKYLNNRNNVHHVYLMSNDGDVVSYMVAQGKVSSVNSKLTNNQQIVPNTECIKRNSQGEDQPENCYKAVESPQMDGSYGTNGDAIFFFTTDGKYVEWNGIYLVSEEPLNIHSSVSLVRQAGKNRVQGNKTAGNSTNGSA